MALRLMARKNPKFQDPTPVAAFQSPTVTFQTPALWGGIRGGNGYRWDPGMEAKMSSADRYANLTSDPFAKGPGTGGFLNISP